MWLSLCNAAVWRMQRALRTCRVAVRSERGDLSAYLAQGILALGALSLTGVVLLVFSDAGQKLKDIITTWLNQPISTGP